MDTASLLAVEPPVDGHDSLLFHPRVVVAQDKASSSPGNAAAVTSTTSNGAELNFSIRFATPPETSYVHVQTSRHDLLYQDPYVLAAYGNLLLIHTTSIVADAKNKLSYPEDWFIYGVDPVSPWIYRLPYLSRLRRWARVTGIISRGTGSGTDHDDFLVAGLQVYQVSNDPTALQELAQLMLYLPTTGQCQFKTVTLPYDGVALTPFVWTTDKVFSSGRSIYWVDVHRGILFCDVFDAAVDDNPVLRFIRLPGVEFQRDHYYFYHSRIYPETFRTVGVCCKGIVKFVDVDSGFFRTSKNKSAADFAATVWSLRMPEMEWDKVSVLHVDDLWSLPDFQRSPVPRWLPRFPIVSRQGEDVILFILSDDSCVLYDWVVTVNLRKLALLSYVQRPSPKASGLM